MFNYKFGAKKILVGLPSRQEALPLALLSWKSICMPKALGGLSIWSMESLSNSLLVKLGWKPTSNQSLFWVDSLRGKYLRNDVSFLNAPSIHSSSWLWK